MNCEWVKERFSLSLYGELSFDDEDQFEQHLAACEVCRAGLEGERRLHALLARQQLSPSASMIASSRQQLFAAVRSAPQPAKLTWAERWRALWRPMSFPVSIHVQPLGAVALVAIGFFGARMLPEYGIARRGLGPTVVEGGVLSPSITRVRNVEPDSDGGQVRIIVEDSRQRVLSGRITDEPIRRLLLTAAKDTADPSVRVESMDILKNQCDSDEVRKALLSALQHDPNPGVRLKALEGLKQFASAPDVRHGLSQVLLTDDNAGVRTQTIDLLAPQKETSLVGVCQQLLPKEGNGYVRERCQRALHDMNASTEIF